VARYKDYDQDQTRLLPVSLTQQIQPGTIEYTINYLVDHQIDLRVFDSRYRNDATGAPAIDPAILLKVILFAYSRGIVSSRQIRGVKERGVHGPVLRHPPPFHNYRGLHLLDEWADQGDF
jgi:transposase